MSSMNNFSGNQLTTGLKKKREILESNSIVQYKKKLTSYVAFVLLIFREVFFMYTIIRLWRTE
jgi:hypothetical protein